MDKYIYLATSMPTLIWGSDHFISEEDFLSDAEKWMNEADYRALVSTLSNKFEANEAKGIYSEYLSFEKALRTELAAYRTASKDGYEYKFVHLPPQLVKDGNPLDSELKLIKYRWDWLEEREFGHYSDLDFFLLYYLKLQLLQRVATFKQEVGEEAFEALVKHNLENTDEEASE